MKAIKQTKKYEAVMGKLHGSQRNSRSWWRERASASTYDKGSISFIGTITV